MNFSGKPFRAKLHYRIAFVSGEEQNVSNFLRPIFGLYIVRSVASSEYLPERSPSRLPSAERANMYGTFCGERTEIMKITKLLSECRRTRLPNLNA